MERPVQSYGLAPATASIRYRVRSNRLCAATGPEEHPNVCEQDKSVALRIAVIWQRFLPYHLARLHRLRTRCADLGGSLTCVEVAAQDSSYGFESDAAAAEFDHRCCFPGSSYHTHRAPEIYARVLEALSRIEPDVVFAPATPFP